MSQISFIPPFAYVLEIRKEPSADFSLVRISTRRPMMAHEAEGARALLHVPRDVASGRYLGCAVIDNFEVDPGGTGLFVFLEKIELFERPLTTLRADQPREDGALDPQGRLKFSFYSEGLRPISEARFLDILASGGERRLQPGFAETATQVNDTQQVPHADDPIREEATRRVRAKLRRGVIREIGAFCCLSGASMNIPGGFSILALSHFRPLGHGGPDTLTNV